MEMAVVVHDPKVSEFLDLSKAEKLLPKALTRLKTVSVSSRDVVKLKGRNELNDVKLLQGVPFDKYKYVGIIGIVVSGEWLLPDNVAGGVTISFVDKRMRNSREATLGTYRSAAKDKRFQFKLIPNYFVSREDAKRNPWQMLVHIKGVDMEEGWCPLTIEVVSVAMCANNVVTKGLKERVLAAGDENVELSEGVVDEFVDSITPTQLLQQYRGKNGRGRYKSKESVDSISLKKVNKPVGQKASGNSVLHNLVVSNKQKSQKEIQDVIPDHESEPVSVLRDSVGNAH